MAGPFSAQIQRALAALGLNSGGNPTFGTVTATTALFGDGSTNAPSIAFTNQVGLGFGRAGANIIGIVGNNYGAPDWGLAVSIGASGQGVSLGSPFILKWSSSNSAIGSTDTGLARNAAGVVEVNNGTAGTFATIKASAFQTTTALVALGGGSAPTLGTIGGSGPTTAAQNTWLRMLDSTGAAFWVPAWK